MGEQCPNRFRTMSERGAKTLRMDRGIHTRSIPCQSNGKWLSTPCQPSCSPCFMPCFCCMFVAVSPIYRYARRHYRWFNNLIFLALWQRLEEEQMEDSAGKLDRLSAAAGRVLITLKGCRKNGRNP